MILNNSKAIFAGLFLAVFTLLFAAPDLALAASPFTSAATTFKSDAVTIFQIVAFIAVMAVGILAAFGRIHKGWLLGCVLGIILIFGAEQIITWIRGAAGV